MLSTNRPKRQAAVQASDKVSGYNHPHKRPRTARASNTQAVNKPRVEEPETIEFATQQQEVIEGVEPQHLEFPSTSRNETNNEDRVSDSSVSIPDSQKYQLNSDFSDSEEDFRNVDRGNDITGTLF